MKITPDNKDRVDEEGYFYELYVLLNGTKGAITVTNEGVSIDYREGELEGCIIKTDISPQDIFGNRKDLNWNRLSYILHLIEDHETNGVVMTSEEMDDLFEYWKALPEEEK